MMVNVPRVNPKEVSGLVKSSDRLRYITDTLGIKYSHLANKLKMSKGTVSYVLSTEVKSSKNARKIAEYLNLNEDWVFKGQGAVFKDEAPKQISNTASEAADHTNIAVYLPEQIKLFCKGLMENMKAQQRVPVQPALAEGAFGMLVEPNMATTLFLPGDILVFEKAADIIPGKVYLGLNDSQNQLILGHALAVKNGKASFLLNATQTLELSLNDHDQVLGILKIMIRHF